MKHSTKPLLVLLFLSLIVLSNSTEDRTIGPEAGAADIFQSKPSTIQNFYYAPHIYNLQNFPKLDVDTNVTCDCGGNDWFIIQNTGSGLVLDASEPSEIRLQHFTGYAPQLWKFERARKPGVYYIVNKNSGTALDVDKGSELKMVIVSEKSGSLSQKWVLDFNGNIINVGMKESTHLTVRNMDYVAGNFVHMYRDIKNKAQYFTLQEKR